MKTATITTTRTDLCGQCRHLVERHGCGYCFAIRRQLPPQPSLHVMKCTAFTGSLPLNSFS